MRQLPRQSDEPRLCRSVGLDSRQAGPQAGSGGDGNDAPTAAGFHRRRESLTAPGSGIHVRSEYRLPVRLRHVLDGPTDLPSHPARRRDQPVHVPVFVQHLLCGGAGRVPRREVRDVRRNTVVRVEYREAVGIDVHRCDDSALFSQRSDDRGADALRGTGDREHPAFKLQLHGAIIRSRRSMDCSLRPASMS